MATQRAKAWFFTGPSTSAGVVFNKYNLPAFGTMEDLMESVPLFLEIGSTASLTTQGLVKLASDAQVKTRTSNAGEAMQALVQPHQLSNVTGGLGIGIGVDISGAAKHFEVVFTPAGLAIAAYVPAEDYIFFLDATDSLPKKTLLSAFVPQGYWLREDAVLKPTTSNDAIDIGTGTVYAGGFYGNNADEVYFTAKSYASHIGTHVRLAGGQATHQSIQYVGGNVYVYGGAGASGGSYGNVTIGYNGSNYTNKTYVGGSNTAIDVASTAKILYVHGGIVANSFTLAFPATPPPGGGGAATMLVGNASGEVVSMARLDGLNFMFGSPVSASVLYYTGADYSSLAYSTVDKYLRVSAVGALEFGDLLLTGKVVNASVAAGAAIAVTKLAALTATKIAVTDGSGFLTTTANCTIAELAHVSGVTSPLQAQIAELTTKAQGNGVAYKTSSFNVEDDLKSSYVMNVTSVAIISTLPALSTLNEGDTFTFTKKFSAGVFAASVAVKGGTGDAIKTGALTEVTSLVIAGVTLSSITLIKRDANYWELLSAIVAV